MTDPAGNLPFVSVVMSVRNEEGYIGRCLDALMRQDYPKPNYEVIVVDGGSSDQTLEILRQYSWLVPHKIVDQGRPLTIPEAMNIGIREARGEIVIKLDGHGYPTENFLRVMAERLREDPVLGAVGGRIVQIGETPTARAIALVRSSSFGVGRGPYSIGESEQFVSTVQCGAYRRELLDRVELFDEGIGLGEDEELNWRVLKAGYKILYTPAIQFHYYARTSVRSVFRQYFWYGDGRVVVLRKHPDFLRVKHLVPAGFILTLLSTLALGVFEPVGLLAFGLTGGVYAASCLPISVGLGWNGGADLTARIFVSFVTIHFGYGLGFLRGVWNYLILNQPARFPGR